MRKNSRPSGYTSKIRLPRDGEMFAVVTEMSGGSRMIALCADNKTRMIRIGGRFKKKVWCRERDLILVKPWVVQSDQKADLVYRYLPTERNRVLRKIPEELNIW